MASSDGVEVAKAFVTILPAMPGIQKDIASAFNPAAANAGKQAGEKAGGGFKGAFGSGIKGVGGMFKSLAGVATAALGGIAFGSIVSGAVEASDATKKFASTLQFAGMGKDQIAGLTDSVQRYADQTVYDLSDIQNMTAQLASNGVPNFEKLAEAAGNLNAVAGGNAETFKSVGMVMTQTAGAGKLTTENWNQLSDAIPGASGKLQEAMKANGAYVGNFRDAMEKGQITAQEFNDAVMQLGSSDVAKQAATSTSTFEGAWGNLQAAVQKGTVEIVDKAMPSITNAMNGLSNAAPGVFAVVAGAVGGLVGVFGQLGDAIGQAWSTVQGSDAFQTLSATLQSASGSVQAFVGSLGSMISGFSTGDGAVSTFSTIISGFSGLFTPIITAFSSVVGWVSKFITAMADTGAIQSFFTAWGDWIGGMAQFEGTIASIVTGMGSFASGASTASAAAGLVSAAMDAVSAAVQTAVGLLQGLSGWAADNTGLLQTAFAAIAGGFAAFKAYTVITAAVSALKGFNLATTAASVATKAATVAQAAFNAVMNANPVMLLVTAIGALVAALAWFFTQTETGRKLWSQFTGFLMAAAQAVGAWFSGPFVQFFQSTWQAIQTGFGAIGSFFSGVWDGIVSVAQTAAGIISTVWDGIVTAAKAAFTLIATVVLTPWQLALTELGKAFDWLNTNVFQPGWSAIQDVFSSAWSFIQTNIIKPFQDGLKTIGDAFDWLNTTIIQPVWNAILSTCTTAWNTLKTTVFDTWNAAVKAIGDAWNWLYTNVIQPVWNGIQTAFTTAWNIIKRVVIDAWNREIQGWGRIFNWLYNNVVKPVWDGIKSVFTSTWNWISRNVIDPFKQGVDNLGKAMQNMKDMASRAWDGLKEACAKPVRWVVQTVYEGGIRKVWNGVADAVGLKLKLPAGPKFARGGVMPGYTPGRDVMMAAVSGGEAIMRPEFTRAMGKDWIYMMNRLARQGGPKAVRQAVAGSMPAFRDGGVVGSIKSTLGNIADGVADFVSNPSGFVTNRILAPVKAQIAGWMTNPWNRMIVQMPVKWAQALADKAKDAIGSIGAGIGGAVSGMVTNFKASAGVAQWTPQVLTALAMLGQPASWLQTVLRRMNQESGGNPNAINNWDSNAKAGHPSQGLMQTIPSTFAAYAGPLRSRGILDPLANIYAGLNYAIHRYGSLAALNRPGGYALGGIVPMLAKGGTVIRDGVAMVGEKGPELLNLPAGAQVRPLGTTVVNQSYRTETAGTSDDDRLVDALATALERLPVVVTYSGARAAAIALAPAMSDEIGRLQMRGV
ncbi:hypothetical protein CSQ85_00160 [Bifidobacterium rousetti]|uniref:tape measure protein n=1 Tax=Bifidobacterium rousetti TaxID=2045439 RepID=UPI00123BA763|nr:tape measure protein [Bifidobacterium rousetti]KAA8820265.1 hypothetical protein CSQ85_00160 [Bifidobacterium rousetti]